MLTPKGNWVLLHLIILSYLITHFLMFLPLITGHEYHCIFRDYLCPEDQCSSAQLHISKSLIVLFFTLKNNFFLVPIIAYVYSLSLSLPVWSWHIHFPVIFQIALLGNICYSYQIQHSFRSWTVFDVYFTDAYKCHNRHTINIYQANKRPLKSRWMRSVMYSSPCNMG
jgi:hypothetical protein